MKKLCLIGALFLLIFCFVSCDNKGGDTTSTTSSTSTTSPSTTMPSTTTTTMPSTMPTVITLPTSMDLPTIPTNITKTVAAQGLPDQVILDRQIDFSKLAGLSQKKVTWGPGREKNHRQPSACVSLQEQYGKYGATFVADASKNQIYLTFDEGYETGYTSKILDVLKEKNVSAVFFVTMDFVKAEPKLIKRMIAEGHIVGNHSTRHPSYPTISAQKQANDLLTLHQYVERTFGYSMKYFRFPMGEFSEESLKVAELCGYKTIFWSFAYKDWLVDDQPDPTASLKLLNDYLHPGAVYLLHAVGKTNSDILGPFIDSARSQGYEFVKMNF